MRARVEHIFGHHANAMKGMLVRTIGPQTLAYHMQRFVYLGRVAASAG